MQNREELSKSRTCRIVTKKVRRNQQKYHPTERHRAVGKHLAFRDNPCEQDSATQDALRNELPPLPHCKHSIGDGSSAVQVTAKEVQDTCADLLSYPLN